ncbi:hypothetical protein BC832DRAFT_539997 [Gaertneriomyces semiglobifer]|nr:hypothetical protein BC832DRAFT_539997 [Gaertneriomyces semiglobifer]
MSSQITARKDQDWHGDTFQSRSRGVVVRPRIRKAIIDQMKSLTSQTATLTEISRLRMVCSDIVRNCDSEVAHPTSPLVYGHGKQADHLYDMALRPDQRNPAFAYPVEWFWDQVHAALSLNKSLRAEIYVNIRPKWVDVKTSNAVEPGSIQLNMKPNLTQLGAHFAGLPNVGFHPAWYRPYGIVHQKLVIMPHEAHISSANMTNAAHTTNVEVGVTLRDPDIAAGLRSQLTKQLLDGWSAVTWEAILRNPRLSLKPFKAVVARQTSVQQLKVEDYVKRAQEPCRVHLTEATLRKKKSITDFFSVALRTTSADPASDPSDPPASGTSGPSNPQPYPTNDPASDPSDPSAAGTSGPSNPQPYPTNDPASDPSIPPNPPPHPTNDPASDSFNPIPDPPTDPAPNPPIGCLPFLDNFVWRVRAGYWGRDQAVLKKLRNLQSLLQKELKKRKQIYKWEVQDLKADIAQALAYPELLSDEYMRELQAYQPEEEGEDSAEAVAAYEDQGQWFESEGQESTMTEEYEAGPSQPDISAIRVMEEELQEPLIMETPPSMEEPKPVIGRVLRTLVVRLKANYWGCDNDLLRQYDQADNMYTQKYRYLRQTFLVDQNELKQMYHVIWNNMQIWTKYKAALKAFQDLYSLAQNPPYKNARI